MNPDMHQKAIFRLVICALAALLSLSGAAREIHLQGGVIKNPHDDEVSAIAQLEFRQPLPRHLALSLSYINEGHFDSHHRDGLAGQIWLQDRRGRLTAAIGAGPYFFCDTQEDMVVTRYRNRHGIGAISSLLLQWPVNDRISLVMRANWIITEELDTVSLLSGLGWHYSQDFLGKRTSGMPAAEPPARNEITVFSGKTIVNSYSSRDLTPWAVEYRRTINRHLEWTLSGLYEGHGRVLNRRGAAAQLWMMDDLCCLPVRFGLGMGGYLARDRGDHERDTCAGLVSLTGSWNFHRLFNLRATWHRVVSDYNRDTDVILAGLGYLF